MKTIKDKNLYKVVIVGAGAAGLMAGYSASRSTDNVILLEKKEKTGKKLSITGGGRCNLTHKVEKTDDLIEHYPAGGKFLYSVFSRFGPDELLDFFHQKLNLPTFVDRGGRIFPVCENSKIVTNAFLKLLEKQNVKILTNQRAVEILKKDKKVTGVRTEQNKIFNASIVILTTGGLSYPDTGSEGDGYKMAVKLGHKITLLLPSLVGLEVKENWVRKLQGLSLRNVKVSVCHNNELQDSRFGEMLFTHWGLSGPVILYLSRKVINLKAKEKRDVKLVVDLKPALNTEQLTARIQRDFNKYSKKQFKNGLVDLLPQRLIDIIVKLSNIYPEKLISQITAAERNKLVYCLKNLIFTITKSRPIEEAEITQGGVDLKEVNPKTMESKLIKGLYFAGEILDIDGYIGGFNLQAAFSTGFVAGENAARGAVQ